MLSGDELPYAGDFWNAMRNKKSLNCYDYAFGNADPAQTEFTQPLARAPDNDLYSCSSVEAGMMLQNPGTRKVAFETRCEPGERKITLMVDPIAPSDYHFMRQDDDGVWSHKPGFTDVRRTDASGQIIHAPHLSNRAYEHFDYEEMCGYYCIDARANFAT